MVSERVVARRQDEDVLTVAADHPVFPETVGQTVLVAANHAEPIITGASEQLAATYASRGQAGKQDVVAVAAIQ